MKSLSIVLISVLMLTACGCSAICFKGQCAAPVAAAGDPDATAWSGTWTDTRKADYGGDLHCTATPTGANAWSARFYGNCGRDYSYQVDLAGAAEGERIVFSGDVDLGEADGGVYTWTGAIDGDKFTGEYSTARGKAGVFEMTRQQ